MRAFKGEPQPHVAAQAHRKGSDDLFGADAGIDDVVAENLPSGERAHLEKAAELAGVEERQLSLGRSDVVDPSGEHRLAQREGALNVSFGARESRLAGVEIVEARRPAAGREVEAVHLVKGERRRPAGIRGVEVGQ